MKLIVNADDFGLSRGVNHGIVDAYRYGIVRSTSLLANSDAFVHAVDLAHENPGLGIGVHLSLTLGEPLAEGGLTLADASGRFHCLNELMNRVMSLDPEEIEVEWQAQIERVLQSGLNPTHLDSHHHVHMLAPVFPVFERLCGQYGLPGRVHSGQVGESTVASPDRFLEDFYGAELSDEVLIELLLDQKQDSLVEVMCHPAYIDEYLLTHSSYALPRARELAILCAATVRECVRRHHIELTNYGCFVPVSGQLRKGM